MDYKKISGYLVLAIIVLVSITSCNSNNVANNDVVNSKFTETTWLLESLNGEKIVYPADHKQNFIIFKGESEGFKLNGFAGCNNISATYDVGDHNTFKIGDVISTKMMCSFADLENKFLKMMKDANSYKIEGYYLTIFNGEQELAVFKDAKELQTH